ncbi:MAG: hypothetical protein ACRD0H_16200 [Actinomycetes bacterium]
MTERVARLGLCIETGSEADAEELAVLAVDPRDQLWELNIERADRATAGQAPPGTREVTGVTQRDQCTLIQIWVGRHIIW